MRTICGRTILAVLFLVFILTNHEARADNLKMTGAELYQRYCASCHGKSGHGDGPVAKFFVVEVPDLTLIARRHGGIFSDAQVEKIIDGRIVIASHGSREMPIWGEEFMHAELGNPDADRATALIVERLAEYVRSLQRPAVTRTPKVD